MWKAAGAYENATKKFITYKIPTEQGQSGGPIIKR